MTRIILNHKTLKFRVVVGGQTVGRFEEIEKTRFGYDCYNYNNAGKRVLELQIHERRAEL